MSIRKVILHHSLGDRFGREHEIDADSTQVLIRGLSYNDIDLLKEFRTGLYVIILQNGSGDEEEDYFPLDPRMIKMNLSKYHTVHIIPIVEGEGPFAAVFAAIGAFAGAYAATAAATATFLGLTAASWIMMGVSFALSGISALLAPSPEMPDPLVAQEDKASTPSFLFNGAVNVTEQGGPVVLVYGETMTGSTVISAGLMTESIPV